MGEVSDNLVLWGSKEWPDAGDNWSAWWGDTAALWYGGILPRIHAFVPTGTILEIAPGYGRWTHYLRSLSERLVVVDLSERCIDYCRERFSEDQRIEYFVNDGKSLEMVDDQSLDFVFSFDSLVHAEADVLESYLDQLARKLKPDGIGFIHHSNIGHYRRAIRLAHSVRGFLGAHPNLARTARRVASAVAGVGGGRRGGKTPGGVDPLGDRGLGPIGLEHQRLATPLLEGGILPDLIAWRAESVTSEIVSSLCDRAGLRCVSQEEISWQRGFYRIDALSVFTPLGSRWDRSRRYIRNPLLRLEAARMANTYSHASFNHSTTR